MISVCSYEVTIFADFCYYFSQVRQIVAVSEFQSCRTGLGRALRDCLALKMKKMPSIQIKKLVNTMSLTWNQFISGTSACMNAQRDGMPG